MHIAQLVKKSIIAQIRANLGEFEGVYFEEILDTDENGSLPLNGDYIYVDMMPLDLETMSGVQTRLKIAVDIIVHTAKELNSEYMDISMRLDKVFRPTFKFADMEITVHSASSRVIDKVLHYMFDIGLYYSVLPESTEPLMASLETNMTLKE